MKLRLISSVLLCCSASLLSQAEEPDSLSLRPAPGPEIADSLPSYMRPVETISIPNAVGYQWDYRADFVRSRYELYRDHLPDFSHPQMPTPGVADIASWDNGSLYASGGSVEMLGLMAIDNGQIGLTQSFGPLTLSAFASANHYASFRNLQTQFGFGGSATYRFSDRLSLTAFGEYYTGANAMNPAMAGYLNATRFGGYFSLDFNDRWGVDVGAQTERSVFNNRWETRPIVAPYYKINESLKIKVDVGGIAYGLLKNYLDGRKGNYGSPVIGPPVGGPPPVAPRR